MSNLSLVQGLTKDLEPEFQELARNHLAVTFAQECLFAKQIVEGNDYIRSIVERQPESLRSAILNVASVGISLNPARKQAYLVPRDGVICLDVSYMGLCHLAQESGSIRFVQAQLVYKNDKFIVGQIGEVPTHTFEAFGDRGDFVGAYCVAKTSDGDFLTGIMSAEEICAIRDRSKAWQAWINKKKKCPWVTDFGEMAKKTVIKRESKMWPKSERSIRLDKAIEVINQHEGIDFEKERAIEPPPPYDLSERENLIEQIKEVMIKKSKGMTLQQKGEIMLNKMKINSFKDLIQKKPDELNQILTVCQELPDSEVITTDDVAWE